MKGNLKMKLPISRRSRGLLTATLAVPILAVVLAGCTGGATTTSDSAAPASGASKTLNFAIITHGDNGSFWSVVYAGAKAEAKKLGVHLTEVYGSQQQGQAQPDDNAENAQIQDAINQHVDGIAVSDHDPALMNPTILKATQAGIPVVLINAGCDDADIQATGAMTCVGQPETLAGKGAGLRLMADKTTNVLCVIHQSGQNVLDRCAGLAQGLGLSSCSNASAPPTSGPACTQIVLSTPNAASNPAQAITQVTAYLQAHPSINAVMSLNNQIGTALVAAKPNVKIGTFDLNPQVLTDINNGSLDFAVDQQQFLQGTLPIDFLHAYNAYNGQSVGGGTTVATGPAIITKANISKVAAAIKAGQD
jgi:simple sugar transport system substrate-binding protein